MNPRIYEEASLWLIRNLRGDAGEQQGQGLFEQWLNSSPAHLRAYIEVSCIWFGAASLDPSLSVDELAALASAGSNVGPFFADRFSLLVEVLRAPLVGLAFLPPTIPPPCPLAQPSHRHPMECQVNRRPLIERRNARPVLGWKLAMALRGATSPSRRR